jgi:hypothetical protein
MLSNTNNDEAFNMKELARRVDRMRQQEEDSSDSAPRYRQLITIAFDSLLPGQQLQGRTTDPNFMRLLRDDVGLGGTFFMISVNPFKRMLRRNGVLCRIDFMDAKTTANNKHVLPSAIDFVISTSSPTQSAACRLVGQSETFRTRVGRWRRCYDPDGEEVLLGWGEERFLDAVPEATSLNDDLVSSITSDGDEEAGGVSNEKKLGQNEPAVCWVDCLVDREDDATEITVEVRELAQELIPLLEKWERLASNPKTYENTNVVATAGLSKGAVARIDPAAVMRQVKTNLGGATMPTHNPHALAYWAAALVNPLPALGISPEIRGRVLEAATTEERLKIVKWGTERSIRNLQGTDPL